VLVPLPPSQASSRFRLPEAWPLMIACQTCHLLLLLLLLLAVAVIGQVALTHWPD